MKLRSTTVKPIVAIALACVSLAMPETANADVALVQNGVARSVIIASPEVMAADNAPAAVTTDAQTQAESKRQRLRESVKDLAHYLQKMSGAPVAVLTAAPAAADKRLPIYIGNWAAQKFGPVTQKVAYAQGFRVVVNKTGIGLFGESDESTSYAIYEVLHRLGCRWYLPSEMGEEIPQHKTITLPLMNFAGAPGTWYRSVWYGDDAFKRRNRMGGFPIQAAHALEGYVTKEQRQQHPEWRAIIAGQPSETRLKWSNSGVQQAVADAIIAQLDKQYVPSISLSPDDGAAFDESDDKAWDAGDYDPVMAGPSITDRYIKFCNIVAEKVTRKYPDVKLGFLAYVQYTQPPIREKLHPNLVPMIAPINYCRAHAMTDACESRRLVKTIVEGWAKASSALSYYNYMFNLAEYSAPYPMMHQMKEELPILYANKVKYWQPETITNNESILPGNYLTIRKSWNPNENSEAILDEFFKRFYGNAEQPMRKYWTLWDDAWTKVDEHAGSGWSYVRRFTPGVLKQARQLMDAALAAAKDPTEQQRVKMQDEALRQFELFMKLRWDLNAGRLTNLGPESQNWMSTQLRLSEQYEKQYAFDKAYWAKQTAAGMWFELFFQPAYLDATRVTANFNVISPPLRQWKYMVDKAKTGEAQGLFKTDFNDAAWKSTDVGVETWATLGIPNYYGPVWYRSQVAVPAVPAGKKVFLWVSSEDGDVKVWVNGQNVPYVNEKGETQDEFKNGYGKPLSFDITATLKPGAQNQITIRGTRVFINELGTGGLLGPVYLYQEK